MMKKYIIVQLSLILTSLFLVLNSCSKEDELTNESERSVNMDKIENVLILKGQGQKIAYRMLNANEKLFIWEDKLSNLLSSNDLNSSQISYIKELQNTLKVENFNLTNQKSAYYKEYLVKMKKIGYTLFSPKEMVSYFSNLNSNINQKYQEPPRIHCGCSTADDWCVTGDCYSFYCTTADAGCGWWLGEDCNGFCATND